MTTHERKATDDYVSIADFYKDRSIFITGGKSLIVFI